jgi:hypothetical protein
LDLPLPCTKQLHGVSKKLGEWYQKTNKTEDTKKLTLLVFADSFQKLYECCQQCVVKDGDYFEGQ